MNVTVIKADKTAAFNNTQRNTPLNTAAPSDEKKAGRFDTFTMTGTMTGAGSKSAEETKSAPDAKQAELIHKLSAMSDEEQSLAAIDAYYGLKREFDGRARALEDVIDTYSRLQDELDFCKKTAENGGIAQSDGKLRYGVYKAGDRIDEDVLNRDIRFVEDLMNKYVERFSKEASDPKSRILGELADIYSAATGGGVSGISDYEQSGCFDDRIEGITADNFIGKLRERIGQYRDYSESLTRSFKSYLDNNKTAENVFRKYPTILAMRREFNDMHEKFHDLEKQIKDDLGINDMLYELERISGGENDNKDDKDAKITFSGSGGQHE